MESAVPDYARMKQLSKRLLHELEVVEDMRIRKHKMLTGSDAAVALPGGTGTFEELLEALTLKRLGLYFRPIVILNTRGFFAPFLEMMATIPPFNSEKTMMARWPQLFSAWTTYFSKPCQMLNKK